MSFRAGIIVTGTELLTGQIADRNGPWIAERLAERGAEVAASVCVGDRPEDIEGALRFMRERGTRLVVTTGGLGPTADDLTAAVVARFAGRELVLDTEMEEKIRLILERLAKHMKFDADAVRQGNRKQAMVPEGAITIDPAGTAPGLVVPIAASGQVIVVLPGPPSELHEMWNPAITTEPVREVLGQATELTTRSIRMFGLAESTVAATLREIGAEADLSSLEITTCLRAGEMVIDVRHRPGGEQSVDLLLDGFRERHGRYIYSEDGATIEAVLARELGGRTLTVAESCTAGLLAARLTESPGASAWFAGGVVAYSDASKTELLGVPAALIADRGAVSTEVAEAMATGALERFDAQFAAAITGVAGPAGGTEAKPVGYVCFCVASRDGSTIIRDTVIGGNRDNVRRRSTTVALHLLHRLIRGEQPLP